MQRMSVGLRPVAAAAMSACLWSFAVHAADPILPSVTVLEAQEGLDPALVPYATETVSKEEIERKQILDIRDAVRDMVNVEVPRLARRGSGVSGTAGREGNTGFQIRGLGGNRVQTLVDGIPQPVGDSFMASHSFGRDYVDPLTLAGIEVHKGASDVSQPAGGIAGTVNMRTLSPYDLLGGSKDFAGRALLGWRSENRGRTLGVALAGKASEQLQWLVALNGDWSDEVKTMGKVGGTGLTRTKPNPEDNQRSSALAKLVFRPDGSQTHVLTVEHRRQDSDITNLHDFDNGTTRAHTESSDSKRTRVSLRSDFALNAPAADVVRSYLAWQDSSSQQLLKLDTTTANGTRVRDHEYDETMWQAGVQAHKALGMHHLQYGVDMARTNNKTSSLSTDAGVTKAVPKGPDSRTTRWATFVEDRMEWGNWMIKPGLRYESVKIAPDAGSIDIGAPGASVVSKRFTAWLPQLGTQLKLGNGIQAFANYQRGFRTPSSAELNNYFGNITPFYGYYILPNPDLKAETSNNFELGMRDAEGPVQWEASAFYGRFRNFIERYADAGYLPSNPAVSLQQSRNQAKATIKGIELKGKAQVGQSWGGLWEVRGAYGYTKGKGEDGHGLESISPHQLKLGVGQQAASWRWDLAATRSAGKKQGDLPPYARSMFLSPSHTVWDLTTQVTLRKDVRLNVGLYNLTDKKYWNWSDVRGVTAKAERTAIDAYSQPGRNVRISMVMDF